MLMSDKVSGSYIVIVTVDAEKELIPDLEAHAAAGPSLFPEFAGFITGTLYKSDDGQRLLQQTEWKSQALYESCINDSVWDDYPSTRTFLEAVSGGQATMDARAFTIANMSRGGNAGDV